MDIDAIVARLAAIIAEETGGAAAEIGADTLFLDIPGWDSVTMSASVLAAEDAFGVELRATELDALERVGDLAALIARS